MADGVMGKSLESMLARLETWKPAEVAEADTGPMARLECVKRDVNVPSVVFQRVVDGASLKEIAKGWGLPSGRFVEWFMMEHADLYDRALKVQADEDAREVIAIADGATVEDISVAKLQADVRRWRASKWDRSRYGDQVQVQHSGRAVLRVEFGTPAGLAQRRELEVTPEPEALPDGGPE